MFGGFDVSGVVTIEGFATPRYHEQLCLHLKDTEPELWAWFRETIEPDRAAVDQAELELLKTTYRLDGEVHGVLAGFAPLLAGRLGLDEEVVLYQDLGGAERNARVMRLGDRIHVVFSGDLLELLDVHEQEAVLAHELAHVALHDRCDRDYLVLDHLVHRADVEAITDDVVGETARRLRLHTEVFADAVAHEMMDDLRPVVSSIVKVNTGLRNVDPDAYLRQARQIIETDPSSSHGWTHPELHVRVACLAARSAEVPGDVTGEVVTQLIDGPDDLDRIDLLGQLRIQEIVSRVLASAGSIDASDDGTEDFRSYVRNYPDLEPARAEPILDGELADATPSVRHLVGALLVDVALLGDGDGLDRTGAFSREAQRQGVGDEFDKVLSRATERTLADVRKLRGGT
ncbi:MAG: M48 family metalloprotease [Ilumatobacter sp.]|uniref:M48 family metalloprotease n=1 Tax=Ilumatobacter sp. TaxID=1967498 RepID=UPI003299D4F8